jgi:hypothetical protein
MNEKEAEWERERMKERVIKIEAERERIGGKR